MQLVCGIFIAACLVDMDTTSSRADGKVITVDSMGQSPQKSCPTDDGKRKSNTPPTDDGKSNRSPTRIILEFDGKCVDGYWVHGYQLLGRRQ